MRLGLGLKVGSKKRAASYKFPLASDGFANVNRAYGLARKLSSAHTGNTYYKISNGAEQVIGYLPDGELDTAALLSFAAGGAVGIKTLQDASGNGIHATQTDSAKMPRVTNTSGALITHNGKPTILFDGVNDWLQTSGLINAVNLTAMFVMFDVDSADRYLLCTDGTHYLGTRIGRYLWMCGDGAAGYAHSPYYTDYMANNKSLKLLSATKSGSQPYFHKNNFSYPLDANGYSSNFVQQIDNIGVNSANTIFGYVSEIFIMNGTAIGATDRASLSSNIYNYFGINPAARELFCIGDSITGYYQGTISNDLPDFRITGWSISGSTAGSWSTFIAPAVNPLYNSAVNPIAVFFAGTNDLAGGASDTATYNAIKASCQSLKTKGFKVVVSTILPRSNSGLPANFETYRQNINSWIRANAVSEGWADAIADVGADATIGVYGASDNAAYYLDKIHPTTAAALIIKNIILAIVQSL